MSAAAFAFVLAVGHPLAVLPPDAASAPVASILLYHRFGDVVQDAMTVRSVTFRAQLDYLRDHDYPVVPLRMLISSLRGERTALPPHAIVITADDGHVSIFREMLPVVRQYHVPVTLFIYPSAISNAPYAMTWEELDALRQTGLFDIQSHTYWHPNFHTEERRLSVSAYRAFVRRQLTQSRTVIQEKCGIEPDLLAWPFGIYDDELIGMAREAGYIAGFTIERRRVTKRDDLMALPRFLVSDTLSGRSFASILP